ncbi:8887_t:CDS:2, partial [Entrophospora sp. SA101]
MKNSSSSDSIIETKASKASNGMIFRLYLYIILIILVPIATYYFALNYIFEEHDTTKAAISAVIVVNALLLSFW